jgi:predicted GNAT family acetyltransferase
MKNHNTRSQWAGCSNFKERREELLKAHEEFQKLLDNGYEITAVKRVRRPRIQREKTPRKVEVSIMNGLVKITVDYTEWQAHGSVGTIIKKIY